MKTMLVLLKFVLPLVLATSLLLITNPEISLADGAVTVPTDNYAASLQQEAEELGFKIPSKQAGWEWSSWGFPSYHLGFIQNVNNKYSFDKNDKNKQIKTSFSFTTNPKKYQWYISDGKTQAKEIPNSNSPIINIQTDKIGTFYYQLRVCTKSFIGYQYYYYSNVAKIIINENHVDATKLSISSNNTYLFNKPNNYFQNSISISHFTEPDNASGVIKWSVSDENLATIDKDGVLTANQNGLSGTISVQAIIGNNNNGQVIKSNPLNITIGGGLKSQTVDEGKKAIFSIANFQSDVRDDANLKTVLYRVDTDNTTRELPQQVNPYQYSVNASINDDGSKYFAKVFILEKNKKTQILETNQATLKVIPTTNINDLNVINDIKITDPTTFRDSRNKSDSIFQVAKGDTFQIETKVINDNLTNTSDSYIFFPLPNTLSIKNITVNGKQIDSRDYSILPENNELGIKIGTIEKKSTSKIIINFLVAKQPHNDDFGIQPYVVGTADIGKFSKYGNILHLNFSENFLHILFKNINFRPVSQFQKDILDTRTDDTNAPKAIMNVDDQRRIKGAKISVTPIGSFSQNKSLPFAQLMFKTQNGISAINGKTQIAKFSKNDPIEPIIWKKDEGILLKINTNTPPSGKYKIGLTWTIENAI